MINEFKERLKSGQPCIGAWLTVPSPLVAEAMVSLGYHWLAVDLEHSTMSADDAAAVFVVAEKYGCATFARLPSADPYLARRLLDAGAGGLIVPCVESAEAFSEVAQHCRYPPKGRRGVGLTRTSAWGATFDSYYNNFDPVLVPQIESRAGVESAQSITSLPVVDAVFLGPYDLSADLGVPGNFEGGEFMAMLRRIRDICEATGTALGIHQVEPTPDGLRERIDAGFRFIAYGTDLIALRHALKLEDFQSWLDESA